MAKMEAYRQVAGFLQHRVFLRGCAELVKLYLLPDHREKVSGRMLIEKTFDEARKSGYRQLYLENP